MLRSETDTIARSWHPLAMAKRAQKQFIREWREFRDLTQEKLADRMGIARSYVSHVENGKRRYDQIFLESAATALNCTPADLIMRDPSQPGAIWTIWDQIPPTERERATQVLQAFVKKTSTHG